MTISEDVHRLRFINQQLEAELKIAKGLNDCFENQLSLSREQFNNERQLVKCIKNEMVSRVMIARQVERKNCEYTVNELKNRHKLEQSQSLKVQKSQLEKYFQSELIKLTGKKDCQLRLLVSHTKRVQRESNEMIVRDRQRYHLQITKLESNFKRQLHRLLNEFTRNCLDRNQKKRHFSVVSLKEVPQQQHCRHIKSTLRQTTTTNKVDPINSENKAKSISINPSAS